MSSTLLNHAAIRARCRLVASRLVQRFTSCSHALTVTRGPFTEALQQHKDIIAHGWYRCCTSIYDVNSRDKRIAALTDVAKKILDDKLVPEADDDDVDVDSDSDTDEVELSDGSGDELDLTAPVPSGRRSTRRRNPPPAAPGSYMVNTQAIVMTEDSS
jgi:hypothetical protein